MKKQFLALLLAVGCFFTMNGAIVPVAAQNGTDYHKDTQEEVQSFHDLQSTGVKIVSDSQNFEVGSKLTASLEDQAAIGFEYQWLESSDGMELKPILTAVSNTYLLTNQDRGKKIVCRIVPVYENGQKGEPVISEADISLQSLGKISTQSPSAAERFKTMNTPAENKFSIEGSSREYVLLDRFENSASTFYVLSDFLTAKVEQHKTDPQAIDPSDPDSIGYFLNTAYVNDGYEIAGVNKEPIEPQIYQYIDKTHEWWVEAGVQGIDEDNATDYSYQAGIGLMTESETRKYLGIYGWSAATEHGGWKNAWYTATGSALSDRYIVVRNFPVTDEAQMYDAGEHYADIVTPEAHSDNREYYARPAFYLGEDFFKNVRVNLDTVGDNVKKAIQAAYTYDDLSQLYTDDELAAIGMTPAAPSITMLSYAPDTGMITLKANSAAKDGDVIVASYDGDGTCKDVQKFTVDEIKTDPVIAVGGDTAYANVYWWDSLQTMKPIQGKLSTKDITVDPPAPPESGIHASTENIKAKTVLTASLKDASAKSFEYQWLYSKDSGRTYHAMSSAVTQTYYVTNMDKNRNIACDVTPVYADGSKGQTVRLEAVKVENLGTVSADSPTQAERFANRFTPEENKFTIQGSEREYVLLDAFKEESESAFYVLSECATGMVEQHQTDPKKIDPQDPNSVGYWLNHTFINSGYELAGVNWPKFEEEIYAHVDKKHEWWVEAGIEGVDKETEVSDYSYKAGLGLMTESETWKYFGKFGWNATTENRAWYNPWLLATGSEASNQYILIMNFAVKGPDEVYNSGEHAVINATPGNGHNELYARPTFYLNRDFFTSVKLDLSKAGENVKRIIRQTYTPEELTIYTSGELRSLGYEITNASIEADTQTIQAKTTLSASMGDEEAVSYRYAWMSADRQSGPYTQIKTATKETYYVTNQDKGKYISCKITPVYADGSNGKPSTTDSVLIENLGRISPTTPDQQIRRQTAQTPEQYQFAVEGSDRRYVMLDEFHGDSSAYYVLADYLTSNTELHKTDPKRLDPNDTDSISYWLNHDFVNSGYELAGANWPALEQNIYQYVDKAHTWWVEAGVEDEADTAEYSDYSYTAGIGLMTESEACKYRDKYGWNITTENGVWRNSWYLATGNEAANKYVTVHNFEIPPEGDIYDAGEHALDTVTPGQHTGGREYYARPAFYLNKDFFKNVKLDLSRTGESVREMLKNNYTAAELVSVYNLSELELLGFINPIALEKTVDGTYKNGQIYIKLDYTEPEGPNYIEVEYTNGTVSGSYACEDYLWEGDRVQERILVKDLPLGENTLTITFKINDKVYGTLVETIQVSA